MSESTFLDIGAKVGCSVARLTARRVKNLFLLIMVIAIICLSNESKVTLFTYFYSSKDRL